MGRGGRVQAFAAGQRAGMPLCMHGCGMPRHPQGLPSPSPLPPLPAPADESAKLAAGMEESLLESQKTAEACVPPESMTFQELFEVGVCGPRRGQCPGRAGGRGWRPGWLPTGRPCRGPTRRRLHLAAAPQRFRESPLVTRLAPDRSAAAARCSAGRDGAPELASYLLMERRCRRWYAAAAAYYERAAERLAALLGRPDTPPSPEQWAAFLAGVGEVEGEVKAAVFAMPTEDARVSVPEIFAGQEMDVEVIDLTE